MHLSLSVIIVILISFGTLSGQSTLADDIVNKAIAKHGGDLYEDAHFEYDFRTHHYTFHYDRGDFQYERYNRKTDTRDILTNQGFERRVNDRKAHLSNKDSQKFSNSINSVHYFTFLPYFLNDEAVSKTYLGEEIIKDLPYHKIRVTFAQEGGGDDHDDVYIYWINKENDTVDYLAYSFHVNGGGVRFREAYNRRRVGGIIFQDYVNYKHDKSTDVATLAQLFNTQELTVLSKIELKQIRPIGKGRM